MNEVIASHNVGDALTFIINHHRKVVGPETIGAFENEIIAVGISKTPCDAGLLG